MESRASSPSCTQRQDTVGKAWLTPFRWVQQTGGGFCDAPSCDPASAGTLLDFYRNIYWKYTPEPDVQEVLTPPVCAGATAAAQAAHDEGQSTLLAIRRLFGMLGSLGLWPLGPPQRPLHKDCRVHSSPRLARAFLHSGDGSSRNYSSDIVGRGLPGIESLHVAAVAEQMSIERETAAPFLVTQLHAAVLRKKTASSQQPRLPPTLRPSWESVLLSVILANAWEMVTRQGGWKQKRKKPSPPGHQGSLLFAETMAQAPPPAVSSLWGSHIQNHINNQDQEE